MFKCSRRYGFTLVELMVVLTVIAVMTAMAIPYFGRTLEQSQANIAAANLRAIWAAERFYWLENSTYTLNLSDLQPPTSTNPQALGLIDPEIGPATPQNDYYDYYVSAGSGGITNTFTAHATRKVNTTWTGSFTIDDMGATSGTLQAAAQTGIVPGFQ